MKNKFILSFILILIIFILIKAVLFSSKYVSDEYSKEYSLFVVSKYKVSDSMLEYYVLLDSDKFILKIYESDDVDITLYNDLKYGDLINVIGKIAVPEYMNNPGEFNYKYYLYSNNIHGEISVKEITDIGKAKFDLKERILIYIYRYREYLGKVLYKYMSSNNIELAKSIIYGETLGLDENTKNSFEDVGLSHIMAISGANITSILLILNSLLYSLKSKRKIINIFSIIVTSLFIILTGSSLSTLRAGIMLITAIIYNILNKKTNPLKCLIIAGVIILYFYPYCIFNIGFILSFLATFGIIAFAKPLNKITKNLIEKIKIKCLNRVIQMIFLNLWLSFAVQIMIIPIQINSFNIFSPTQIIFNVCVSGVTNIITILAAIFILFSYVPILNCIVVKFINICICILMLLVNLFKTISLNISVMDLPFIVIVLYYCIILSFVFKIYLKKLLINKKCKLDINFWKKYSLVQILFIIVMIISIVVNIFYFNNLSSFVYFFNVGQGETSYIKAGKNSVIVDIGSLKTNLAFNTVANYFKMKNISGVDVIILSHMHTDHVNGLERYLQKYNVGIIIYSKPFEENKAYDNFKEIINKYDVKIKEAKAGEIYNVGDIQIEILLPKKIMLENISDLNANSLICRISIKDKSILYMGDGTYDTEKELLKSYNFENIDILKVGHHGSKTSTSEEYIEIIRPQYAVISAKKSYYNHPHEDVLKTLRKYNVSIYITEKVGAIKFNMYNL